MWGCLFIARAAGTQGTSPLPFAPLKCTAKHPDKWGTPGKGGGGCRGHFSFIINRLVSRDITGPSRPQKNRAPTTTAAPPAHRHSFIKTAPHSGAARAGLSGSRGEPPGKRPGRGAAPRPRDTACPLARPAGQREPLSEAPPGSVGPGGRPASLSWQPLGAGARAPPSGAAEARPRPQGPARGGGRGIPLRW